MKERSERAADLLMRVWVVDDERNIRSTLSMCLEAEGCRVETASSFETAIELADRSPCDLAFIDLKLGSANGLDLLSRLRSKIPSALVVIITAFASFETVVEAMKCGAWDFLPKPFTPEQIRQILAKAREQVRLRRRISCLEDRLRETCPEADFETSSPAMHRALELTRQAAVSQASVLFRGESGTGKSIIASFLHQQSGRSRQPFVTVNCPLLHENLLASELFGHVRGSFTGAVRDQIGKVEAADGGTLFLDEIGEMAPSVQAQLLRYLQDRHFERVGDNKLRRADTRIICATNRHLEDEVQQGRFREDLWFRINVVEIFIPPLRERPEDILPLARHFLAFFSRDLRRPLPELAKPAQDLLQSYSWPGNVRELRNVIERALIVCPSQVIDVGAFPERMAPAGETNTSILLPGSSCTLEEIEREHVMRVIRRTKTLDEAAAILGIDVSTLWRKRKKFEEAD
ncbi:MAG: sigma-54 dependent transcriptional regulator [Candidatus Ozemobacteraceae bacterium]